MISFIFLSHIHLYHISVFIVQCAFICPTCAWLILWWLVDFSKGQNLVTRCQFINREYTKWSSLKDLTKHQGSKEVLKDIWKIVIEKGYTTIYNYTALGLHQTTVSGIISKWNFVMTDGANDGRRISDYWWLDLRLVPKTYCK